MMPPDASVTTLLRQRVAQALAQAGGWLPFDRFMALALYAPGLGYYAHGSRKFGALPGMGSDFVTAPELSPLFGRALAAQVAQALAATGSDEVWEFGAGSGALAAQLLAALQAAGQPLARYTIVDVSGSLRARQQQALAAWGARVHWADALPDAMTGVVIGNEVLDAMPVQLLARKGGVWHERGVALPPGAQAGSGPRAHPLTHPHAPTHTHEQEHTPQAPALPPGATPPGPAPAAVAADAASPFVWADRPTVLRPPVEPEGGHDYLSEIHPQAEAFIATLAERLLAGAQASGGRRGGAAFFIDYGFPEREYYHPQRHMGTLACHRAHQMDDNPLADPGQKDITAHVNFTGVALAGQQAGLDVLGYTSQARFLINCGIAEQMQAAPLAERANALKLVNEHEMGELFKVIGFATPATSATPAWQPIGFAQGDRTHTL